MLAGLESGVFIPLQGVQLIRDQRRDPERVAMVECERKMDEGFQFFQGGEFLDLHVHGASFRWIHSLMSIA